MNWKMAGVLCDREGSTSSYEASWSAENTWISLLQSKNIPALCRSHSVSFGLPNGSLYPSIVASGSQRSAVLHLIFSIQTEILYLWCELEKGKWTNEAAEDPDVCLNRTDCNISIIASTSCSQGVIIHQLLRPIGSRIMERVADVQKPVASPTPAHCLRHHFLS